MENRKRERKEMRAMYEHAGEGMEVKRGPNNFDAHKMWGKGNNFDQMIKRPSPTRTSSAIVQAKNRHSPKETAKKNRY